MSSLPATGCFRPPNHSPASENPAPEPDGAAHLPQWPGQRTRPPPPTPRLGRCCRRWSWSWGAGWCLPRWPGWARGWPPGWARGWEPSRSSAVGRSRARAHVHCTGLHVQARHASRHALWLEAASLSSFHKPALVSCARWAHRVSHRHQGVGGHACRPHNVLQLGLGGHDGHLGRPAVGQAGGAGAHRLSLAIQHINWWLRSCS